MVFFTDHYNAISIGRLPSKTKIGKDSWYLNNSLLCKPEFSSATNTFFIKTHAQKSNHSSANDWWEYTKSPFKEAAKIFFHHSRKYCNFKTKFAFFIKSTKKKQQKNILQQVTGENTPSFALKRLLRPYLKFPLLKKILQFQEKICLF